MIQIQDRRDAILTAVAAMSERLLADAPLPERVDDVLAILGHATAVDRVYLFEVRRDEHGTRVASQRHEWVADGVEPQLDNPDLQAIPMVEAGFGRWLERFEAGIAVHGDVVDFPPGERPLLTEQDIASLVTVPVAVDGDLWGFLGFDATGAPRGWQPSEVEVLRTAGAAIGAAMSHDRLHAAVQQARVDAEAALAREQALVRRLQDADQLKEQFLEGVSHELRTPLAVVAGAVSLLHRHEGALSPEQRQTLLDRAGANAARLEQLVSQLLDLKDISGQGEVLRPRPSRIADLLAPACEAHGVELVATDVDAEVDVRVVTRILRLLLDNVSRHTPVGTACRVSATREGPDLVLAVEDEGPGIPVDERSRVLLPFEQGTNRRDHAPGVGVGLTIVANLARRHGGTVRVDERPGGGTRVRVRLRTGRFA